VFERFEEIGPLGTGVCRYRFPHITQRKPDRFQARYL